MSNPHQIGMPAARLDEIELRLLGADFRPWGFADATIGAGGPHIVKASQKAVNRAFQKSAVDKKGNHIGGMVMTSGEFDPTRNEPLINTHELVKIVGIFKLVGDATADMGRFVAHAPRDIEDLLNEVKMLRKRLRDAEMERDEFKKEMLSLRVEKTTINEKLTEQRRAWRAFQEAIGK